MTRKSSSVSGEPLVSVIIPVYERTELLKQSIQSVIDQTFERWESIVVVDHRSAHDVVPLVKSYDDDRIRAVVDRSSGVSGARNAGIDLASGSYIAFLDSDDVWKPSKLERQLQRFQSGPADLGLVYTGFVHDELNGMTIERRPRARGDVYLRQLERDQIHPPSTVLIRTECIDEVGLFDTDLPTREDYELWIRVTEHFLVDYVDELLVQKREQSNSLSKDFKKRLKGDLLVYDLVRRRVDDLDVGTIRRRQIFSAHQMVIGRDYESYGDRWRAVRHLCRAVVLYPLQTEAWLLLCVALLGINRNGKAVRLFKRITGF